MVQQAPLVFRSVFFLRDFNEAKGSWAVASCATTGGGASLLYFDAALWLSSASSPLFLYGPLFLLFVFVFFVSSMWVCLCCPSRRVLWSPCCSYWFFIGATYVPPKSNPRGGWGSSISCFSFVGFFNFRAFVLRMWVYARASCSCSSSSHKSSWAHPRRGTWPDFVFVFVVVFVSRTKIGPPKSPKIFIYDPILYAKTRQDDMYIRQPVFSHLLWFQSCRCLVLSLHIYLF